MVEPQHLPQSMVAWESLSATSPALLPAGSHILSVIGIDPAETVLIRAAIIFPDKNESLLFCFPDCSRLLPNDKSMPHARGFSVDRCPDSIISSTFPHANLDSACLMLSRSTDAPRDIFCTLAQEAERAVRVMSSHGPASQLEAFFRTLFSWQRFMARDCHRLTDREEAGLFSEIHVLGDLIATGVPAHLAVSSWTGPNDGLHDFKFHSGSLEIKSTCRLDEFSVEISNAAQLDVSLTPFLAICALQLGVGDAGQTLPALVDSIHQLLAEDYPTLLLFKDKLLNAGYTSSQATLYDRRFFVRKQVMHPVDDAFPKITTPQLMPGISRVEYCIDMDAVSSPKISIAECSIRLGAASA